MFWDGGTWVSSCIGYSSCAYSTRLSRGQSAVAIVSDKHQVQKPTSLPGACW